jgi:hypothetical protein
MGFTTNRATAILASEFSENYYIGLSSTAPTDSGGNVTEPSASTGYERAKIGTLNKSIAKQISNGEIIFFNESIGAGYGTVSHFAVYTTKTGGTPTFTGALTEPQTIGAGYIPIFRKNQFVIGLDKGALESYG